MKYRFQELDALRGVAAIGVVLYHFITLFPLKFGLTQNLDHEDAIKYSLGRYGVELFFLISGFVISLSIENSKSTKHFLISRFSRLFPVFWLSILATSFILMVYRGSDYLSISQFFANTTMLAKAFGENFIDGSYWTLSYELIFYFFISIVYFKRDAFPIKIIIVTLLAYLITAVALNSYGFHEVYNANLLTLFPHFQLFIGGMIFYQLKLALNSDHKNTSLYYGLLLSCVILQWGLSTIDSSRLNYFSASIITCYYILFYLLIHGKLTFLTKSPLLLYFGAISYSLYLIHQEIGYVVMEIVYYRSHSHILAVLLASIFVMLLAHIMYKLIELPSNKSCKKVLLKLMCPQEQTKIKFNK